MWIEVLVFILLAICAVFDGARKEIPVAVVWFGILMAVVLHIQGGIGAIWEGERTWTAALASILPGAAFWAISLLTGEKVGYGDGWMLVMVGLFTGLRRCFMILLVGLMLESTAVLVLLAVRRISTDKTVPFAPFLLMGMGVMAWL